MILAVTIALAIVGVHLVIDELLQHYTGWSSAEWYDETHEALGDGVFRKTWQTHFAKPTFYCVTCMSSVWGSFFYVCLAPLNYHSWDLVAWYVPTIAMVALFATIIKRLFDKV